MKHAFKLQKNKDPLWHLFTCVNCGTDIRVGKWEASRLLKGERIFDEYFLPSCSPRVLLPECWEFDDRWEPEFNIKL